MPDKKDEEGIKKERLHRYIDDGRSLLFSENVQKQAEENKDTPLEDLIDGFLEDEE